MGAGGILAVALTAAVLFAATNADDIVVVTALSISSHADGRPRRWHIWAGQHAGFAILIAVSPAAAAGVSVYCLASTRIATHRAVIQVVQRWGQWVIPVVFIVIGFYAFTNRRAVLTTRHLPPAASRFTFTPIHGRARFGPDWRDFKDALRISSYR